MSGQKFLTSQKHFPKCLFLDKIQIPGCFFLDKSLVLMAGSLKKIGEWFRFPTSSLCCVNIQVLSQSFPNIHFCLLLLYNYYFSSAYKCVFSFQLQRWGQSGDISGAQSMMQCVYKILFHYMKLADRLTTATLLFAY